MSLHRSHQPRILHLDMPRALTTTLRAFDFRNAAELQRHGLTYDQADLGPAFWSCCLQRGDLPIELDELFDLRPDAQRIAALTQSIAGAGHWLGHKLTPFGIDFKVDITSSSQIEALVSDPAFHAFLAGFIDRLAADLKLADEALRIVSIGVESARNLVIGAGVARALRERLPASVHIVLGKHSYENFSLSLRRDDVIKNAGLSRFFDRIIIHEEQFAAQLLAMAGISRFNTDVGNESGDVCDPMLLIRNSCYLKLLPLPPVRFAVLMPLSRNKCYWKRCSFCVQIHKHLSDRDYDDRSELERAVAELDVLSALGFRYVNFSDEAVSPAMLRRLCDALEEHKPDVHWTVRIIADVRFKDSLVRSMKKLGCIEVLFGLETVNPETAQAMGKVSEHADDDALMNMLAMYADAGIGIFLNLIHAFPTESDADFASSLAFARKARHRLPGMTLQINKFALFYGTDIYRDPARFGVTLPEPAEAREDLRLQFDYADAFGRRGSDPGHPDYFAESLGMTMADYQAAVRKHGAAWLLTLFQVNYASFGLMHKHQHGRDILDVLLKPCDPANEKISPIL